VISAASGNAHEILKGQYRDMQEWGGEKCKGSISLCLSRSEDGPAIPAHGGKGFEEIKSTYFSQGGKEIFCYLLDSVGVCHQMYFVW